VSVLMQAVRGYDFPYDIELRSDMNVHESMTDYNVWFFDLGISQFITFV